MWTFLQSNPVYYSCSSMNFFNGQPWFIMGSNGYLENYNTLSYLNNGSGEQSGSIELIGGSFPNVYGAEDMIMNTDGVTVATKVFENGLLIPCMYKMDYSGNYLWHTVPEGNYAVEQINDHIAPAQDGGYVSCSVHYSEQPNPQFPNDPAANNTNQRIWLWKVNNDGVFQWQRFYEYFSFDSVYYQLYNTPHDFKATPDGGFIIAGEATYLCPEPPLCLGFDQQGWLIKVDACGCLVPGCDENCVVNTQELSLQEKQYFKFGPNPVHGLLNIYLPPSAEYTIGDYIFDLRDLQGRVLQSFQLTHSDTTYMIDLHSFSSGTYLLTLSGKEGVVQTERVVVEE